MMIAAITTGCLSDIVLALTALQRLEAMRGFSSGFMAERWFIQVGVIAIIILTVLLFAVSFKRIRQERKISEQLFIEYAEKRGMTVRERQILIDLAINAELKRIESIFTLPVAFDRGVSKMIEENVVEQGNEQFKQLHIELSYLREKLGFRKQRPASTDSMKRQEELSSRQIPIGKQLYLRYPKNLTSADTESTIIKNDDIALTIKLKEPVDIALGQSWSARYYSGASAWEFDTLVISCEENIVILKHSDSVRFINRRRFLRVPVKKSAYVANFPFTKKANQNSYDLETETNPEQLPSSNSDSALEPPSFVPAVVTELGGPGLIVNAALEVKVGDRVLLVFRLSENNISHSTSSSTDNKAVSEKVVEDIGVVKRVVPMEEGSSIAVELTGLRDSDVNELIRATNLASIRKIRIKGNDKQAKAEAVGAFATV